MEIEHTSRVLSAKRFSIDFRTYTRPSILQFTTSICRLGLEYCTHAQMAKRTYG
jgi:hypothetical protein